MHRYLAGFLQHHAQVALVENRPELLQARRRQAVRLVNRHEHGIVPNFEAHGPVLFVCCGIGVPRMPEFCAALIIGDETDRLRMSGLEQLRDIFDDGGIGLVLIGMPGLEKRLARYPQLYSRVGFVHEFKPLSQADVRQLLREGWAPSGVRLPDEGLIDEEALAILILIAEGKFRLLHRLLQQIGRVMEINRLDKVTGEVVEAARESLVIGTA